MLKHVRPAHSPESSGDCPPACFIFTGDQAVEQIGHRARIQAIDGQSNGALQVRLGGLERSQQGRHHRWIPQLLEGSDGSMSHPRLAVWQELGNGWSQASKPGLYCSFNRSFTHGRFSVPQQSHEIGLRISPPGTTECADRGATDPRIGVLGLRTQKFEHTSVTDLSHYSDGRCADFWIWIGRTGQRHRQRGGCASPPQ